jgi:hypothetical protein
MGLQMDRYQEGNWLAKVQNIATLRPGSGKETSTSGVLPTFQKLRTSGAELPVWRA